MSETSFRSQNVVLPDGVRPATVVVRDGRVVDVAGYASAEAGVIDAGASWMLPGVVDTHVHINQPGRTQWEGFESMTRAAAAGGVTTLIDMPLNSIPSTCDVDALQTKRASAAGICQVDVGFWGGVVPGNAAELGPLFESGALGFKCFLSPSGVPEFTNVSEADLRLAMPEMARLGAVLLVHAELPAPLEAAAHAWTGADPRSHATWLASRPPAAEHAAIELMIRLSRETGCRVHIVHLASAGALEMLRNARAEGLPITVETCPHYLTLAADDVPDGGTAYKCAPPLRDRENQAALWTALGAGDIDLVVTDHSPSPPDLKCLESGRFDEAWGGIASIELALSVVWTAAQARGHSLADVTRWMSAEPARLAGLSRRKGAIAVGADADIVFFDPESRWTVDASALHHRHKVTPYDGAALRGRVRATYVRGAPAFDVDSGFAEPSGRILTRNLTLG